MSTPPFPADQVADARRLVTRLDLFLADHAPAELAQMRHTAWAILSADHDHRRRATQPDLPHTFPEDAA